MSCCYLIIPYKLNGFKLGPDMDEMSNSGGEADIDGNFLEQLSGSSKWSTDPATHSPHCNSCCLLCCADEHVVLPSQRPPVPWPLNWYPVMYSHCSPDQRRG